MPMDISKWILYNPKIVTEHTAKKYYGQYLYKLVVYCPAGRAIDSKRDVVGEIQYRRSLSMNINGWWGQRMARDLDHANVELLTRMRVLRQQRLHGIKMRVEEPRIQIYAETENQLIDIVKSHFDSADYQYFEIVSGPENSKAEALLNSGAIIRRRDLGYTHKIILRDGKYSAEVKHNLLQYLNGLGIDLVKLPGGFLEMLTKSSSYMWNSYFYTNDPSVVTFVNLIHPGLVLNIHPLVVADNK